jgi:hypothetical protein
MTQLCSTCRWWGTAQEKAQQRPIRHCVAPMLLQNEWPSLSTQAALLSSAGAALATGGDWHCANWQDEGVP